jgi:subtilisin family serine protease
MLRTAFIAGALFAFCAVSFVARQSPVVADDAVELRSEYVVVFKPGRDADKTASKVAVSHGATHVYKAVFNGFSAALTKRAADALRENAKIESVEPVIHVQATAEVLPDGVDRIDAEKAHLANAFGAGANVAVIDSGIDLDHPDLAANVNVGLSRTFVSRGKTTTGGDDDNGHGSHVAGTIAAVAGNNQGVIGVAPQAKLISLKVLNKQGSGSTADIIAALDYITAHNNAAASFADAIHVANCSFGGSGSDTNSAFRQAFEACVASGCFIAVAAGNESANSANYVPAAYNAVFTVSAMNPVTSAFASFSNFGPDVDMAAPGVSTHSTYKNGGYATLNGTSMATPHVAGAAALYVGGNLSAMNRFTAETVVRSALLAAGEAITLPGDPDAFAEPLVDAEAVVGPVSPAVEVAIATDKPNYTATDMNATLTVTLKDEFGTAIPGLSGTQVVTSGAPVLSFGEVGGGTYEVLIDISGFVADTDYFVTVTATDNRPVSGDKTVVIRRQSAPPPPAPGTIYVSSIGYRLQGPHLFIDVTIGATPASTNVSGVSVAITLNLNGTPIGSATSSTDVSGLVSFKLMQAPNGSYTTTINSVSKSGLTYTPAQNAVDPGIIK